jgi:serine/threonine protein kinase
VRFGASGTTRVVAERIEVGKQVGDYAVTGRIGEGGMGAVYLAEDESGTKYALKVLLTAQGENEEFKRRFERESRYASSLNHPNIVRVHEFGESSAGQAYMVMEYVEGRDLASEISAGQLSPERTIAILEKIANALDAVHETGLYHRDVKPANVLVADDEETGELRPRLTDFGLSKQPSQDSSPLTSAGFFVGTCQYVAPEQILAKDLDHRVDVYSLGCLLYECLAGEPPFKRPREEQVLYAHIQDPPPKLTELRPDLPAEIDDVIAKSLAKDPDERYSTCGELVEAARQALEPLLEVAEGGDGAPTTETPPNDSLRLRVTAGNAEGAEIRVDDEFLIGRQEEGAGTLGQDAEISRHHARIARSGGGFAIEDLGSTNGSFVNGRRITGAEILSPGDRIQLGATTMVVQVSVPSAGDAGAAPAGPAPMGGPPTRAEVPVPQASEPDADTRSSAHQKMPQAAAMPPFSIRLDIDPAAGKVTLKLDEESDPVTLVYENGRWTLATDRASS